MTASHGEEPARRLDCTHNWVGSCYSQNSLKDWQMAASAVAERRKDTGKKPEEAGTDSPGMRRPVPLRCIRTAADFPRGKNQGTARVFHTNQLFSIKNIWQNIPGNLSSSGLDDNWVTKEMRKENEYTPKAIRPLSEHQCCFPKMHRCSPSPAGAVMLLRAPHHLDSKLSYLRDSTRKTHTSPSGTRCSLTKMKVICKKLNPSEVIDGNASERKQKVPLTKNTKEKNFSGHDGGHVTISPTFKPMALSMASCSPTFSQQLFDEDTPGSFPQVAEVLKCSGMYPNHSEPSTGISVLFFHVHAFDFVLADTLVHAGISHTALINPWKRGLCCTLLISWLSDLEVFIKSTSILTPAQYNGSGLSEGICAKQI
ncbi:hypothetical protein ACRRTK_018336 [Alexandromys fortis]